MLGPQCSTGSNGTWLSGGQEGGTGAELHLQALHRSLAPSPSHSAASQLQVLHAAPPHWLQICSSARAAAFCSELRIPPQHPQIPPPTTRMGQNLWGAGSVGCPSPEAAPTAPPRAGGSHTVTSPHGGDCSAAWGPPTTVCSSSIPPPQSQSCGDGVGGGDGSAPQFPPLCNGAVPTAGCPTAARLIPSEWLQCDTAPSVGAPSTDPTASPTATHPHLPVLGKAADPPAPSHLPSP